MTNSRIIKDQSSMGQFSSAIAQICDEKGIDKDRVLISIEAALAAAYKKDYGKKGQIIMANMDEKTSEVKFRQFKEVVDETTRTIDDEYIPEEVHQVPEQAIKSEEKIERHQSEYQGHDEEIEETSLPKFNSERDVLLKDAKKVVKKIALGDYIEFELEGQDQYGRIASQTAKQVIIQKIREAEREAMYEEFKGKEGEVINGTVQRVEGGKVFVDLGKSTGILFPSDQIPGEEYRADQRLKLYIDKVDSNSRSIGINLSRKHPQLLVKLFELEVPEIFTGNIEIKAVAREAGNRSKIAVLSNEDGLDPIGSCVGQKGTRVQAIIDELNGEKIDIIEWIDNPEKMIAQALSPAKVIKVELVDDGQGSSDTENEKDDKKEDDKDGEKEEVTKEETTYRKAIAYVKEDQLSLAIGRRGQNVRLAAKLTGWNINVEALDEDQDQDVDADEQGESEDVVKDAKSEEVEVKKDENPPKADQPKAEKTLKKLEKDEKKDKKEKLEKEDKPAKKTKKSSKKDDKKKDDKKKISKKKSDKKKADKKEETKEDK
jgi:N utilization substance protein A